MVQPLAHLHQAHPVQEDQHQVQQFKTLMEDLHQDPHVLHLA